MQRIRVSNLNETSFVGNMAEVGVLKNEGWGESRLRGPGVILTAHFPRVFIEGTGTAMWSYAMFSKLSFGTADHG